MNLKKKVWTGLLTATLGISLISGGTYAYFNDVEETNNNFEAGTLDLRLDADSAIDLNFSVENIKPGDKMYRQVQFHNEGSLDIQDVTLNTNYTVNDAKEDNYGEDFADHILVTIYEPRTSPIVENVPLSELDGTVLAENGIAPGGRTIYTLKYEFKDNGQSQNQFQGDSIDLNVTYTANQEEGTSR